MPDIDFLPAEYRQRVRQRKSQAWRIVVAAVTISLVVTAATMQHFRWHRVRAELAEVTPAYVEAVNMQGRLADLQRQLLQARACAELYTYLRHPWPRTQLLAAVIKPLPDEMALQQVQIVRQPADASSPAGARPALQEKPEQASRTPLLPAQRDLAKLRELMDPTPTVMTLVGTAAGTASLYRYLRELDATEMFDKVELDWFDSVDGGQSLRFQVVLGVQPGYGQLGGPAAPYDKSGPLVAPAEQPARHVGSLAHGGSPR